MICVNEARYLDPFAERLGHTWRIFFLRIWVELRPISFSVERRFPVIW